MTKTIFGTSGIRKKFTRDFSGPQWLEIGMAIGTYLGKRSSVLVGRDTRQTAELVEYALISGLLSCGCEVYVLQGSAESPYVTTSTIAYATKHFDAAAGVMVTASHNTPEYIGIKIWQKTGMGFTPAQEEAIDEIYAKKSYRLAQWNDIIKLKYISNANDVHVKAILDRIHVPIEFKERKITVAIDPGNGAACEVAPNLLQKLGVNVVTINAQPDGLFPGRESEPNEANLRTLIRMMRNDSEMDIGIAYDGDADRVRFVNRKGVLVDGDQILLLLAMFSPDKDVRSPFIVTPVNSSTALDDTLKPRGISVSRTRIGDIPVAIRIQEINARLGGEISGTYTWPEFHLGPDALYTTAKLLDILATHGSFDSVMQKVPRYIVVHDSIDVDDATFKIFTQHQQEIELAMTSFLHERGIPILEIIKIDGILARYHRGFLLVRQSGTSSTIRLTCEHENGNVAEELLKSMKEQLTRVIKGKA
jgi:phosphoglucosamine mutase